MIGRVRAFASGARPLRRVLVDSRTALNTAMVLPVVRAMAGDPRVQFAFTASENAAGLRTIHAAAPPGSRLIHPRAAALRKWDAYLSSDFMWATLPRGTRRVQMFHGVAGKYGFDAPTDDMRAWHRLFFINARRRDNFIAAGVVDADSPALRLVGMPKVDCLVDGSLQRDAILRAEGLDPGRPTLLYAPTWSAASSLNVMGLDLVERLLRLPVTVLVKLHDRSYDPRPVYSGGIDWRARLLPILTRAGGRLVEGVDIAPYLVAADLLVTDHSSAGFEYLLRDRPVIRLEVPELLAHARVHPDYVQLLAEAARSVRSPADAVAAVEAALAAPAHGSASRRHVASQLFYRPGSATYRAAAELCALMELDAHPSLESMRPEVDSCLQSA
jgi:hypothetical protein